MGEKKKKSEVVQAWLEKDVKKKGKHILQDLVFDAPAATNMSYHQIILQGGLPFSVKLTEKVDDEMRQRMIKAEVQEFGLLSDDSEVIASGVELKKYLG